MSIKTATADLQNVNTFEELLLLLNTTAKKKQISLIDTSSLSKANSVDEFTTAINKIYDFINQRGFDFYFADRMNLFQIFLEKKEICKKVHDTSDTSQIFEKLIRIEEELPPPEDEFFPASLSNKLHIVNLLQAKNKEFSDFLGHSSESDSRKVLENLMAKKS